MDGTLSHATGAWRLSIACELCGGYALALQTEDIAAADVARAEAVVLLADLGRGAFCLGCQAAAVRDDPIGTEPFMFFDPALPGWSGWLPFDGLDGGLTVDLGIRRLTSQPEAEAAMAALTSELPAPLTVAEPGAPFDRDLSTLRYDDEEGRWVLWLACEECGGADVPVPVTRWQAGGYACERAADLLASGCDCP